MPTQTPVAVVNPKPAESSPSDEWSDWTFHSSSSQESTDEFTFSFDNHSAQHATTIQATSFLDSATVQHAVPFSSKPQPHMEAPKVAVDFESDTRTSVTKPVPQSPPPTILESREPSAGAIGAKAHTEEIDPSFSDFSFPTAQTPPLSTEKEVAQLPTPQAAQPPSAMPIREEEAVVKTNSQEALKTSRSAVDWRSISDTSQFSGLFAATEVETHPEVQNTQPPPEVMSQPSLNTMPEPSLDFMPQTGLFGATSLPSLKQEVPVETEWAFDATAWTDGGDFEFHETPVDSSIGSEWGTTATEPSFQPAFTPQFEASNHTHTSQTPAVPVPSFSYEESSPDFSASFEPTNFSSTKSASTPPEIVQPPTSDPFEQDFLAPRLPSMSFADPQPSVDVSLPITPRVDEEELVLDLDEVLQDLISQERFDEAVKCQALIKLQADIKHFQQQYEDAKTGGDKMKSLDLRNKIEGMKWNLQSSSNVSKWKSANPEDLTIAQMRERMLKEGDAERAGKFSSQFTQQMLASLAAESIQKAANTKKQAKQFMTTLLSKQNHKPQSAQTRSIQVLHVKNWETGLDYCQAEIAKAEEFIIELTASPSANEILQTEKVQSYLKGIEEVWRVACRLKEATNQYQQYLHLGSPITILFLTDKIDLSWEAICSALKEYSVEMPTSFEAPTNQANTKICELCMLSPAPQDKTLQWDGKMMHSSCANFWCNRVSQSSPSTS